MTVAADEMAMKYTRKELEEKASAMGLSVHNRKKYPSKADIAEALVKHKGAREAPAMKERKAPASYAPPAKSYKKGVYAKRTAINGQVVENKEAVADIGMCVKGFQGEIMNEAHHILDEVGKMHGNIANFRASMDTKARDMSAGVREVHRDVEHKAKANRDAAHKMCSEVEDFHKDVRGTRESMDRFAMGMNVGVRKLQDDIARFQNVTSSFIKDFYFG